jgi:hypothetical protein
VDEDWLVTRKCVSLEAMPSIQMSGILLLKSSPNGNGVTRAHLPFCALHSDQRLQPLRDPHASPEEPVGGSSRGVLDCSMANVRKASSCTCR